MFSGVMLASGKYWPFNDAYHDPYSVVPESYQQHPDAFLHTAYSVLELAQDQPDALVGYWGNVSGDMWWLPDAEDSTTDERVKQLSSRDAGQAVVDLPGFPGGQDMVVTWQRDTPHCVYFFYRANRREDWERIDHLRRPMHILPATYVALVYHPTNKPPKKISPVVRADGLPHSETGVQNGDPPHVGKAIKHYRHPINANWSVYYR